MPGWNFLVCAYIRICGGPKTEKQNRDMLHVEQIMWNAGWFDKSPNGPADVGDLTPIVPGQLQSGKDWTAVVQQKRQEIIDKRCQNIPEHINDINKTDYDQEPSAEVKIATHSVTLYAKSGQNRLYI